MYSLASVHHPPQAEGFRFSQSATIKPRSGSKAGSNAKLCSIALCSSKAKGRGLCVAHGGGPRCKHLNCSKGAKKGGYCIAHGGGIRCKVMGCKNSAQRHNLCMAHGGGQKCKAEGCNKCVVTQGLCLSHGGGKRCGSNGCPNSAGKAGLCARHSRDRGSRISNRAATDIPNITHCEERHYELALGTGKFPPASFADYDPNSQFTTTSINKAFLYEEESSRLTKPLISSSFAQSSLPKVQSSYIPVTEPVERKVCSSIHCNKIAKAHGRCLNHQYDTKSVVFPKVLGYESPAYSIKAEKPSYAEPPCYFSPTNLQVVNKPATSLPQSVKVEHHFKLPPLHSLMRAREPSVRSCH